MKTVFVPLIGDPKENLYQLGLKERDSFKLVQERVSLILSANNFLRYGQDIISRAKAILQGKKDSSFFDQCVEAYSEGLGIEASEYKSFLSIFEFAAHYGQIFPELKALLPGCTSLFEKKSDGHFHSRLLDFPLIGTFNEAPRLYYWKIEGKPAILNYSCEGLALLFLQTIHDGGFSLSLHHKPGVNFHKNGESIFKITFDGLFESPNMNEFRRELRKKISLTKWGYYMMDNNGTVMCSDIDGPSMSFETYNLGETSPLIFSNIPLHKDQEGFEPFLQFCQSREMWLKDKMGRSKSQHTLDLLTDVKDQKMRKWLHPSSTLSTIGAYQVNLNKGLVHVKEGTGALTASDAIIEFNLQEKPEAKMIKGTESPTAFEKAWKHASIAQAQYDQGDWDNAYHHLQMAESLMPHSSWKEIFRFYLTVWNFKFITNKKELALVYRDVKKLVLPESLKDQWLFMCMRLEKKLGFVHTIDTNKISAHLKDDFIKEMQAPMPIFNTWMKLLYPRIEILDIFSPHQR